MKRVTPAAWRKMLTHYEENVFNVLMRENLQPHEREAILVFHDLLRTRASGVRQDNAL